MCTKRYAQRLQCDVNLAKYVSTEYSSSSLFCVSMYISRSLEAFGWQYRRLVPKTIRTQDKSYPRQLVPKKNRTQDNSYPRQLIPRTILAQDNSYSTCMQNESYPRQLVPRTTRTQSYVYPVVRIWQNSKLIKKYDSYKNFIWCPKHKYSASDSGEEYNMFLNMSEWFAHKICVFQCNVIWATEKLIMHTTNNKIKDKRYDWSLGVSSQQWK